MDDRETLNSHKIYANYLTNVNSIKFTSREISVMSCILSSRSTSKIASILNISPRTVESHTYNLMGKLHCNSRESVIDFIEKSGKVPIFRNYYTHLLIENAFEKSLKSFAKLGQAKNLNCSIIFFPNQNSSTSFIELLKEGLTHAGAKVFLQPRKDFESLSKLLQEMQSENYRIYFIPQLSKADLSEKEITNAHLQLSNLILCFPLQIENECVVAKECLTDNIIDPSTQTNDYYLIFDILTKIFHHPQLEKIKFEFKEKYNSIVTMDDLKYPVSFPDEEIQRVKRTNFTHKIEGNQLYLLTVVLTTFLIIGLFLFFQESNQREKKASQLQVMQQKNEKSVRSDLIIPMASSLLHRTEVLSEIEKKLNGHEKIQTIALSGIGGAGKTTLARQHAREQKADVVWEINAETLENLKASFENLAQALAITEEDKKILGELQGINSQQKRDEKILEFVKGMLKSEGSWFLIYDNVENFIEIQKHFPQDSNTWGQGKIIVTTRDGNIQNNNHVNHTIFVEKLDAKQKLELFTKIIMNDRNDAQYSIHNEETKKFLEEIPPFPLDVCVAAYYIKTAQVPYKVYLDAIFQNDNEFEKVQKNILKDSSHYIKTRYNIITSSLKKLIDIHKDFAELLLCVSLLDSQNIPIDLLKKFKNSSVVDNFIYNIKKYSLTTNEISPFFTETSTFSLHRSTQAIALAYLLKELKLEKNGFFFTRISTVLENCMSEAIEGEDIVRMKFLLPHYKAFLTHKDIIGETAEAYVNIKIGSAYSFIGEEKKAKQILLDVLSKINKEKNRLRIAQLLTYLGLAHRALGEHAESKSSLEESFKIYETHFPENYAAKTLIFSYLGNVYRDLHDYKKSEEYLQKSLLLYEKYFPNNLHGKALCLTYLGNLYSELGNYKKAEIFLEQSTNIFMGHVSEHQNGLARSLGYFGIVQKNIGNYEKAKNLFKMSLLIYQKLLPRKSINVAWMISHIGNIYRELGDYKQARNFLRESTQIYEELTLSGNDNPACKWQNIRLGDLERETGNYEEARKLYYKGYLVFKEKYGEDHIATADSLTGLGKTFLAMGDLKTAEQYLQKASEITKKIEHSNTYLILESLAEIYLKKNENEIHADKQHSKNHIKQARDFLIQALNTLKTNFPETSPHKKRIELKLKNLDSSS